jgi:hypothetical protein
MERGMRPVGDASDETVFDGIDVYVIDVTGEVVFVAYRVFPVTPLPNPVFAFCIRNEGWSRGEDRAGEMAFFSKDKNSDPAGAAAPSPSHRFAAGPFLSRKRGRGDFEHRSKLGAVVDAESRRGLRCVKGGA